MEKMINVNFMVDKYGLLFNTIRRIYEMRSRSFREHEESINQENDAMNQLINLYGESLKPFLCNVPKRNYSFISLLDDRCKPLPNEEKSIEELLDKIAYKEKFSNTQLDAFKNTIRKLIETEEFKDLYAETISYKNEIEKKFATSNEFITSYLKNVLGEEQVEQAENQAINVIIMSPRYKNGTTDLWSGTVTWGHPASKKDPAYDVTFITHELLHARILPYKGKEWEREGLPIRNTYDKLHSLIQFITDKELHSRLTDKNYSSTESHDRLRKMMMQMYPFWLAYLYKNEDNPYECIVKNMLANPDYSAKINAKGNYVGKYSPTKIASFSKTLDKMSPYEFIEQDFTKGFEKFGLIDIHQKRCIF